MPILEPDRFKPIGLAIRKEALDSTGPDGYEQGGLVYFTMDGHEMVLIVRERRAFDVYARHDKTLKQYANSRVSNLAYAAAKALENLIPHTTRW